MMFGAITIVERATIVSKLMIENSLDTMSKLKAVVIMLDY